MGQMPTATARKVRAKYIAPISEAELVARMLEAGAGVERPEGVSAERALEIADQEMVATTRRMARAAMLYWRECIANANKPS